MVIHVLGEYDIRLKATKYNLKKSFIDIECSRKAIMNAIKIFYMSLVKENIPIYGVVCLAVFYYPYLI
jgi:hypothetical protein